MKLLFAVATSLLVALAPNPVQGGYPNPHVCETDDLPGIKCHSSVSIQCTNDATGEPCLNPDQDNEVPFMTGLDLENCQTIPVTIKFKMCNLSDKPMKIIDEETYINYIGQTLPIPSLGSSLNAGACVEVTKKDNWDTCRKMRPMSLQLDGRIIGDPSDWTNYDENAHCYCYLYKRATFSYIQDEPIDEDFCTDSNFIITECSRPGDARWSGSYLELYNPVCAGKKIGIDLQIVRIDEDGNQPNKVALKNILVDSNGFIVLCNNKAYGDNIYGAGTCDGVSIGSAGPTFSGKDTFVLTFGGDVTKAIDIYGNTGPDRETQNISDGRCVRKTSIVTPRRIWNANDWVIFSGNSKTSDMDPHVWKAVDPIEPPDTEVVICDSRASKFKFRFQPRLCADSDNFVHRIGNRRNLRAQHRRHLKKSTNTSDKFWCQESSSTAPPSSAFFRVVIKAKGATETSGDKYLDIGNVQNGDELTIVGMNGGTISTELNIYIYDSGSSKVQEIMFHSSCSMDLSTGDTFGSLELIGFQNDKQSVGF